MPQPHFRLRNRSTNFEQHWLTPALLILAMLAGSLSQLKQAANANFTTENSINVSSSSRTQTYANHRMTDYELVQASSPIANRTNVGAKNSSREMDLAESVLRPQVAVQIYASSTPTEGNRTGGSNSNVTNHKQTNAMKNKMILLKAKKKKKFEEDDQQQQQQQQHQKQQQRDHQAASSRPVSSWQYESSGEQEAAQTVDWQQLDGNTFTLAGPMINAIITVPGQSGEQRASSRSSSSSSNIQDDLSWRDQEEQLARNISAANVERAIVHLLNSEASADLEFSMNMNGNDIVLNPISKQANSLLSTSLPSNANHLLESGDTMLRQHSHHAPIDTDTPKRTRGSGERSRVDRRYARLVRGDAGADRRSRPSSRRDSSRDDLGGQKRSASLQTTTSATAGDTSDNSDDPGEDELESEPTLKTTRRNDEDDDEGELDIELPSEGIKAIQSAKRFKTSSVRQAAEKPATSSPSSADRLSQESDFQSDEPPHQMDSFGKAMKNVAKNIGVKRTMERTTDANTRRQTSKRRRSNQEAKRASGAHEVVSSSAERSASIHGDNQRGARRASLSAGRDEADHQPTVVIKGEDVRRFEQLLENLRSLSVASLSGVKGKNRNSKASRSDDYGRSAVDDPKRSLVGRQSSQSQAPESSPTKRNLQHRPSSSSSSYSNEHNCDKSSRRPTEHQPEESSSDLELTDSSSSNAIERDPVSTINDEDESPAGNEDSNNNSEDAKRGVESNEDLGDESQQDRHSGRQAANEAISNDDVNLDESDTNLSQSKTTIEKPMDSGPKEEPKALYVRKTILQSYYDNNGNGNGNGNNNDKQAELNKFEPEVMEKSQDSRAEAREQSTNQVNIRGRQLEDVSTRQMSKSQLSNKQQTPELVDGAQTDEQQAGGGGKEEDTYIDYNRLDDREIYRGSESKRVRVSVPLMKEDQMSGEKQYLDQIRVSEGKIPYATQVAYNGRLAQMISAG